MKPIHYADLLEVPYRLGGRRVDRGLDCFGVLLEYYRRAGVALEDPLPDYGRSSTKDVAAALDKWGAQWRAVDRPALEIGDVAVINWPDPDEGTRGLMHVGVIVDPMPVRILHGHMTIGIVATRIRAVEAWVVGYYRHEAWPV